MDDIRQFALDLCEAAGALALDHQRQASSLSVDAKGQLDFVTRADVEVEAAISAGIREKFPADAILAEESGASAGFSGRTWIIDPIDGTHNFLRGMTAWGISLAVVANGAPLAGVIHSPATGVSLSAARGQGAWRNGRVLSAHMPSDRDSDLAFTSAAVSLPRRLEHWLTDYVRDELGLGERRIGCATAGLSAVIQSQADLYIGFGERLWDIAAAAVILEEVGLSHSLDWSAELHGGMNAFICGRPDLVARASRAVATLWPLSETASQS